MFSMDISIIIVSYKVKELLRNNLEALFESQGDLSQEIFVVDNNSGDGSVEMVRKDFPQVNVIANSENLGFAAANNQAIRRCSGKYVLLLNPDMQVFPDTLEKMVSWMDHHPEAGVAGCKLVNEQGEVIPHLRKFPGFWDQLAIVLKLPHLFPFVLNRYIPKNIDYNQEQEVDSIRGSFFMIRGEVLKELEGLDERYFIWFEEVDLCRHLKETGWKVMYTPEVQCRDHIGKSFTQVPKGRTQKYFRDSMLKYFRKWHPGWQYWILRICWAPSLMVARLWSKIKNLY